MIFAKTTAYGLDNTIKILQGYLDVRLASLWSGTINIYGLIQKTKKDNRNVAEAYLGTGIKNKEYGEIFLNDKVAATIGFYEKSRDVSVIKRANIDCIFTVRLDLLYPSSTTRENELCLLQAQNILKIYALMGTMKLNIGIEEVFTGFDTSQIKYLDMHPWFVFSYNFDIQYEDNSKCL